MQTETPSSNSASPLAFFIPGLNGGGAQRVFVTLVNTLVNMTDHPIHLVTARTGGAFENLVDEQVVRVVLGQNRVSQSILPLASYIRRHRPVALVSTLDYCNVVFLLSTFFTRVPFRKVIREANVIPNDFNSFREKVKSNGLRLLMRWLYPLADDVIIITGAVEDSLSRERVVSADKFRRIPNPVVLEEHSRDAPEQVPVPDGRFILAIGRLSYQKGFDVLIQAFAQLPHEDTALVILGEGPLASGLKALAEKMGVSERVFFPGFVPNARDYLRAATLFVLSSRWEGFSNVLTEALAAGTQIVAADCPGSPREVLEDGRLGRLVPVGDPSALAAAISLELSNPSASAQDRMLRAQCYLPEKIARQYLEVMMADQVSKA